MLSSDRMQERLTSDRPQSWRRFSGPRSRYSELNNYRNRATCANRNRNHATLFSWPTWLAGWIASAYDEKRRRATWQAYSSYADQGVQSWLTAYIFNIGYPCYGSIGNCQNTVSADQYHVTRSWLRFRAH